MSDVTQPQLFCLRQKPLVDRLWTGTLVWGLVAALTRPGLASTVLLAAALVVVPLGLQLISPQFLAARPKSLFRALAAAQPWGAVLLACAFFFERGWLAALLAVPWLAISLLAAATGAAHLLLWWRELRRLPPANELAADVALIFLVVGGAWTVIFLSGRAVPPFSDAIIQLTAVHFHYAGFALPIVAGQVARLRPGRITSSLVRLVAAATLALAAGITFSPALELAAAALLVTAMAAIAILQFRLATASPHGFTALATSAVCLLAGAALALGYAWGGWSGHQRLPIELMIPTHGLLMSGGFSLLALLGWQQRNRAEPRIKKPQFPKFP